MLPWTNNYQLIIPVTGAGAGNQNKEWRSHSRNMNYRGTHWVTALLLVSPSLWHHGNHLMTFTGTSGLESGLIPFGEMVLRVLTRLQHGIMSPINRLWDSVHISLVLWNQKKTAWWTSSCCAKYWGTSSCSLLVVPMALKAVQKKKKKGLGFCVLFSMEINFLERRSKIMNVKRNYLKLKDTVILATILVKLEGMLLKKNRAYSTRSGINGNKLKVLTFKICYGFSVSLNHSHHMYLLTFSKLISGHLVLKRIM